MPAEAALRHERFLAWLTANGVDMSLLRLVPRGPSGLSWGAVAATALTAGASCATIPLSIALTEDAVRASRVAKDARRLGLQASVSTLTYVLMLVQRADAGSHWGPYLRAIPARHTDPLSWSRAELALLRGSNLLPAARLRRAELRAEYDAAVPRLCAAHPKRYRPSVLSWREFLWAHSSFISRAFPLQPDASGQLRLTGGITTPDELLGAAAPEEAEAQGAGAKRQRCLLPLLDMLNHRYAAPIIWQSGEGAVGFAAGADVAAGDEVFNNYGPKSNEELLLSYGFILDDNPQDSYHLEVARLAGEDADELRAKEQLLGALALPRRHTLCRPSGTPAEPRSKRRREADDPCVRGCLPPSLLRVMRLAVLNRAELLALHGRREPAAEVLAAPVSGRSEMAALRALLRLLEEKRRRLVARHDDGQGAEHDGDAEEGEAAVRPEVASAAQGYIRGQRYVLDQCIEECTARLAAVATATTRLSSARDWRAWNYAARASASRRPRVLTTELSREVGGTSSDGQTAARQSAEVSGGVVRATSDIPAGAAVLSVPRSDLLTAQAAFAAGAWGEAIGTVGGIDEDTVLMLFLVHERARGAESRWAPFFAALASLEGRGEATALPPVAWGAEQRSWLGSSEAASLVEEQVCGLHDLHDALFPALSDAHPALFPAEVNTLEALQWACGVLAAFSVQLAMPCGGEAGGSEQVSAIVPLVEAAPRHRSDAVCFHEYDRGADAYVLRSLRRLSCGEEVTVCHGQGGDRAMLLADRGASAARVDAEGGAALQFDMEGQGVVEVRASVADEGGALLVWPPWAAAAVGGKLLAAVEERRALLESQIGQLRAHAGDGQVAELCRANMAAEVAVLACVGTALRRG